MHCTFLGISDSNLGSPHEHFPPVSPGVVPTVCWDRGQTVCHGDWWLVRDPLVTDDIHWGDEVVARPLWLMTEKQNLPRASKNCPTNCSEKNEGVNVTGVWTFLLQFSTKLILFPVVGYECCWLQCVFSLSVSLVDISMQSYCEAVSSVLRSVTSSASSSYSAPPCPQLPMSCISYSPDHSEIHSTDSI